MKHEDHRSETCGEEGQRVKGKHAKPRAEAQEHEESARDVLW